MGHLSQLQIPVELLISEKKNGKSVKTAVGTIYFGEGETSSKVCEYVMKRQRTKTGLWLLQARDKGVVDNHTTIKDSKHKLTESKEYVAVYYNGPDLFLMMS